MYWIEVDMSNGKTIREQSQNLNEMYDAKEKYTKEAYTRAPTKKSKPVEIRTGSNVAGHTGTWKLKG